MNWEKRLAKLWFLSKGMTSIIILGGQQLKAFNALDTAIAFISVEFASSPVLCMFVFCLFLFRWWDNYFVAYSRELRTWSQVEIPDLFMPLLTRTLLAPNKSMVYHRCGFQTWRRHDFDVGTAPFFLLYLTTDSRWGKNLEPESFLLEFFRNPAHTHNPTYLMTLLTYTKFWSPIPLPGNKYEL